MPSKVHVSELSGIFVVHLKDFKTCRTSAKLPMALLNALSESEFVARKGGKITVLSS